jgi:hypothetical protein
VSDRLDLADQAPREGEVWRDKIRNLRGKPCRTPVLQVIPERAEGTQWATGVFVEHTTPGGDYRSKLEYFLRDNERDVPLADEPRAGYPRFDGDLFDSVPPRVSGHVFRCPKHDVPMVEGKCPERRCPWKIETLDAPRLTREMVVGEGLGRIWTDFSVVDCCLCGAALRVGEPVGDNDRNVERHRAWHDRLERLLEAAS